MAISVKQCDQNASVIIWTFERQFTLEEYRAALAKSRQMAREIPDTFDLIVDVSVCEVLTHDSFFELEETSANLSPHLRSVAIIGSNIVVRTIISAFRQTNSRLGNKIYFADTLDHARKLVCPDFKRSTDAFSTQEFRPIQL